MSHFDIAITILLHISSCQLASHYNWSFDHTALEIKAQKEVQMLNFYYSQS